MLHVSPQFQSQFRELAIDADAVFDHPLIVPWRTLPDRENCVLDARLGDGQTVRWHVKRYPAPATMEAEVRGFEWLNRAQIPTASLIGWGTRGDGRAFVITDDLNGYEDSEKLIERGGVEFGRILEPTADLSAKLHRAGLHHRDLYLCHFFTRVDDADVRVIDVARVRPLPRFLAKRWVVKDLAQFWYSTTTLAAITDAQRERWLERYAEQRADGTTAASLRSAVLRKAAWIARHDARLKRAQPDRNISIPQ